MAEPTPEELLATSNTIVEAPAGCGKTELICRVVRCHDDNKLPLLVITHTNAGRAALVMRLKTLGVHSSKYHVDTIAGISLRFSLSYPNSSGLESFNPAVDRAKWPEVYSAFIKLSGYDFIKNVIENSYSGLLVDEYQDCTVKQHEMITIISNLVPTWIFGDPMQGIFGFGNNTLPEWSEIFPEYQRIELSTPYRWNKTNPELGQWILEVRNSLKINTSLTLSSPFPKGLKIINDYDEQTIVSELFSHIHSSAMLINKWSTSSREIAKKGRKLNLQAIEPNEPSELFELANKLQNNEYQKIDYLNEVLCKSAECISGISQVIMAFQTKIQNNNFNFSRYSDTNKITIAQKIEQFMAKGDVKSFEELCLSIESISNSYLFRPSLWRLLIKLLSESLNSHDCNYTELAWQLCSVNKHKSKHVPPRVASTTLLLKGLECDNSLVVIDSDPRSMLTKQEFYVAISRGCSTLTIFSKSNNIHFKNS